MERTCAIMKVELGNFRALASVRIGAMEIRGFKVVDQGNGGLSVAPPCREFTRDGRRECYDIVRFKDPGAGEEFYGWILEAYGRESGRAPAEGPRGPGGGAGRGRGRAAEATRETCAQTAKRLRRAFKAAFPGVRFSVRSSTYSGGASIDVSWAFGPTERAVGEVAEKFAGSTLDAMTDSKESKGPTWVEDLDGVRRLVCAGADFVFCGRGYGDGEEAILRAIAREAAGMFADVEYVEGKALYQMRGPGGDHDLGVFARQVLAHSGLPDGFHGVRRVGGGRVAEDLLEAF